MEEILCLYKPQGLTPLQLIEKFRKENPIYKDIKIGFAGRLDPLAHGAMLLTIDEGNKNRQLYLGLDKYYKFSVLFGVKTDSYDYLGFLDTLKVEPIPRDLEKRISDFTKNSTGKFLQSYPPFSSKPINGIPLYKLAKKRKILKDELPVKEVEIYEFNLDKIEYIDSVTVKKIIFKNLRKIKGHFRQTKTIKLWKDFFEKNSDYQFTLASFEIKCSSGTYVRSLAHRMGQEFKSGAIAFEILRTKVGEFELLPIPELHILR